MDIQRIWDTESNEGKKCLKSYLRKERSWWEAGVGNTSSTIAILSARPPWGAWCWEQVPGTLTLTGDSALTLSSRSFSLLTALHAGKQAGGRRSSFHRVFFSFLKMKDKRHRKLRVEVRKNVRRQCVGHPPNRDTLRKGRILSSQLMCVVVANRWVVSGRTDLMGSLVNCRDAFACYIFPNPPTTPDS